MLRQAPIIRTITFRDGGVNTTYSLLRGTVQHRFSQGYTLLATYTYSYCFQNTETLSSTTRRKTKC